MPLSIPRRPALAVCATVAGVAFAASTVAQMLNARLTGLTGDALVVQGDRFLRAQPNMLLRAGERVITLSGASLRIVYETRRRGDSAACEIGLGENSAVTVGDGKSCLHEVVRAADEIAAPPPRGADAAFFRRADADSADPLEALLNHPLVRCTLATCGRAVEQIADR